LGGDKDEGGREGGRERRDTYLVHLFKGSLRQRIKSTRNRSPRTVDQHVHPSSYRSNSRPKSSSKRRDALRNILTNQMDGGGREGGREGGQELAFGLLQLGEGAGEEDEVRALV